MVRTSFLAQKNRHLWKNDDSSNLSSLLPTHSCVIYIVYGFDIADDRGMVVVALPQVSVFNIQILRSDKLPFSPFFDILGFFLYSRRMRGFVPIVSVPIGEPCLLVYQSVKTFLCISANNTDIHRKFGGIAFDKMNLSRSQRRG